MLPDSFIQAPIRVFLLAGEPSGDQLGARLMQAIKDILPDAKFAGIGGPNMQQAGLDPIYPMERLSVMGFFEPLKRAKELLSLRKHIKQALIQHPPSVFIGIDAPDFNLPLEKKLKANQIPVVHYVSPTIWAWRASRIKLIKKAVDHMLLIFPFEQAIYDKHQVPASFVGHTLANAYEQTPDKAKYREALGLQQTQPVLALLVGSRVSEVKRLGDDFIRTALAFQRMHPHVQIVLAMHNQSLARQFAMKLSHYPQLNFELRINQTASVLKAADIAMVTSGTATLEATLSKTPHIVVYRTSPLTFAIAKRVIKTPFISMTNIMAGEKIVDEFIQNDLEPKRMAQALSHLLDNPQPLIERFHAMHQSMKQDTNVVAASIIAKTIKREQGCKLSPV